MSNFPRFVGRIQSEAGLPRLLDAIKSRLLPAIRAGETIAFEFVTLRSVEQNRLFHSCFKDLARDCLFHGRKVEPEIWKRVLLQAFYEATKDDADFVDDWQSRAPQMIPTLDGSGFLMIGVESKRFTKNLASGFITFVHSVGDDRGVTWSRTSLGRDVPDDAAPPPRARRREPEGEPA